MRGSRPTGTRKRSSRATTASTRALSSGSTDTCRGRQLLRRDWAVGDDDRAAAVASVRAPAENRAVRLAVLRALGGVLCEDRAGGGGPARPPSVLPTGLRRRTREGALHD